MPDRWIVALDIDGTILHEDGSLTDAVHREIRRVEALGHEVLLATGRSPSMTLPVVERLGITPDYLVCANGAIVMRRDPAAPAAYRREIVETFDPRAVLETIRGHLGDASYAVEDAEGVFRFTGTFPDGALGVNKQHVSFEELLVVSATRVVVLSPGHAIEEFLGVVERMGLHKVSYNVGWTAWLDIAPDGVNKATGLRHVSQALGVPAERVLAIGDGRNDIDMLGWAGIGVAMGQSPPEVVAAADETTGTEYQDGVAATLAGHFPG